MRDLLRHGHRTGNDADGTDDAGALWVRCPRCKELQYRAEHEQLLRVCGKCRYHFRMPARERILITVDEDSFHEYDSDIQAVDPLGFVAGSRSYRDKLTESIEETGQPEGFIYGTGALDDLPLVVGAIEMEFIGGSMGSVVGEKVVRALELGLAEKCPVVLFSTGGGARMQEGVIALMQMAKVLTRLDEMTEAGLPYFSVMADPCYGGVTASFAMMGDVNIGEPGAFIGFAGARVIEQTTREKLPPGAAQAEFLLAHGMLDLVVPRGEMRLTIGRLLKIYGAAATPVLAVAHAPAGQVVAVG
jgi:acetyl-CoA carboxylase carboxyl transferase subunit beta